MAVSPQTSMFQVGDKNAFRLFKMIQCEARSTLYQVFLWGCTKAPDEKLDDYLKKKKGFDMTQIKKTFDQLMRKKMKDNPKGDEFDISLLCKSIQVACEDVKPQGDPVWYNVDETQLEYLVTAIKNFRNDFFHLKFQVDISEMVRLTEKLRGLLEKVLKKAGERYVITDAEVSQKISEMNCNITDIAGGRMDQLNLEDYENEVLFEELKALLLREAPPEVKEKYLLMHGKVKLVPFLVGVDFFIEIEMIFTRIEIVKGGRNETNNEVDHTQLISMCKSATGEGFDKILVLRGPTGSGKTTFVKHIISEWNKDSSVYSSLDEFDFLIHVECRNRISELYKLISVLIPNATNRFRTTEERDACMKALNLLILVDGIDEINEDSQRLVEEVLLLASQPNICVLCTTRSEGLEKYNSLISSSNLETLHFKLTGIPAPLREEFVKKYHEKMRQEGRSQRNTEDLLGFMRKNSPHINEHFRIPLNMVLLVFVWSNDNSILNKNLAVTDLFNEGIRLTKKRLVNHLHGNLVTGNGSLSDLEEKIDKLLKCLYSVSLKAINSDEIVLQKHSLDTLKQTCTDLDLPYKEVLSAFLVFEVALSNSGPKDSVCFFHKGIQEFYAAKAVVADVTHQPSQVNEVHENALRMLEALPGVPADIIQRLQNPTTNLPERTICHVLRDLFPNNESQSQDLKRFNNTLRNVLSIFNTREDGTLQKFKEELVCLIERSGTYDYEDWLEVFVQASCNSCLTPAIASKVPLHRWMVRDSHVAITAQLLEHRCPRMMTLELSEDPDFLQGLGDLLQGLRGGIKELHLMIHHHYRSPVNKSSDLFLEKLNNRECLKSFRGVLSAEGLSFIPHGLTKLHLALQSDVHASTLGDALSKLPDRVQTLRELRVHVPSGISTASMKRLPGKSGKRQDVIVKIHLSNVADDSVEWACDATYALRPVDGKLYWLGLQQTTLTATGLRRIVAGLRHRRLDDLQSLIVTTMNVTAEERQSLKTFARDELGCALYIEDNW